VVTSDAPSSSLEVLAETVLMKPHTPMPRGSRFVVCEVLSDALRFVSVRHRTLGGVSVTDQTKVSVSDIIAQIARASVLASAARTNPIWTTD
jgi:hypothetical protein